MAYSKEQKDTAALLWRLGANAQEIALELGLNSRWVVYKWAEDEKWDKAFSTQALIVKTARRVNWLIEKAEKSEADYRELHQLGELLIKEEKAEAYRRGATESGQFSRAGRKPDQRTGEGKPRQKKQKNDVSALSAEQLQALEEKLLYPHQLIWIKAGEDPATYRQRFILKSRQIGATYTFAWEAFKNAVLKGHNQIFISSTKAQAEVFKAYIFLIAKEHFEIELTGNPTKLSNGAEICYLSPNSNANSRSGDVYFDEVFYTRQFDKMEAIAKPMGTLQQYKHTYFGAPTAISHPAYTIWSGERFTKYHPETQIEVSKHADLFYGRKDPDGFWRCVTTVDSAIEMGWDQVSLEQLRLETPDPVRFENIYRCKFIDDTDSVFKLGDLLECGVDPLSWYPDFDRNHPERPAGDLPCALGYDPARDADNASLAVLSIPQAFHEKFRLFAKQRFRGLVAGQQAQRVVNLCRQFKIEYMDIDKTGPGLFIPDIVLDALVQAELDIPRIVATQYSDESKTRLVQKGLNVIAQRRFEYDENDHDLPLAFMTIRQSSTPSGNSLTYYSVRTNTTGHGDEAWAVLHAMQAEGVTSRSIGRAERGSRVVFAD